MLLAVSLAVVHASSIGPGCLLRVTLRRGRRSAEPSGMHTTHFAPIEYGGSPSAALPSCVRASGTSSAPTHNDSRRGAAFARPFRTLIHRDSQAQLSHCTPPESTLAYRGAGCKRWLV